MIVIVLSNRLLGTAQIELERYRQRCLEAPSKPFQNSEQASELPRRTECRLRRTCTSSRTPPL